MTIIRFFLLVFIFLTISSAYGDDYNSKYKDLAKKIAFEVISPYCPGRSLADCPSKRASDLKDKILLDLENGKSVEQIKSQIFLEYGDHLDAKPKTSGFSALAWLIPICILFIGVILIFTSREKVS